MQTTDATGLREFITELRNWWSFSDSQVHTHSWHSREDFIERVLPKFSIEKKPSDGGEPITEEWLTVHRFQQGGHQWILDSIAASKPQGGHY